MAIEKGSWFGIEEDRVVAHVPMPQYGMDVYQTIPIMDKTIFKKCYKMWIEDEQDDKKEVNNNERLQDP